MAITEDTPLSPMQKAFCDYYIEYNNGTKAAIKAGYKESNARIQASQLLTRPNIQAYIQKEKNNIHAETIANARQVMEFFTRVMNGEEKDQFGLDASIADRTRAAQELAKRTVDFDNRAKGNADMVVSVKLDWGEDE